jgi:hypothetical protein
MTVRKNKTKQPGRSKPPSDAELDEMIEEDVVDAYGEFEQIVAVCARGKSLQRVPILDLPLPTPRPEGADWIMAFRRWARGGR